MAPAESEQHQRKALALAAHDASARVTTIHITRRYAGACS
jgi:cinnamyl-alcohol dehydrogenase